MPESPHDALRRPLRSLRLSVTDRCNLRCQYCMPEQDYVWLPRREILSFREILRLTRIFASLGVGKLRLTGGEPLLRQDLPELIAMLRGIAGIEDLALTTNGLVLADCAAELRRAALNRLTVSLDTLHADRFRALTGIDGLARVREGLAAAREAAFQGTKINTVLIRGFNDDEIGPLLTFAAAQGAELRFIEYMDVAGASDWDAAKVVPKSEILERVEREFGAVEALPPRGSAPARVFRNAAIGTFGIIASTTEPFCGGCDRSRLTADGNWFLCLYAEVGINLRGPLREGADDEELRALIQGIWSRRQERGAEERAALHASARAAQPNPDRHPHREMHTRGG